MGGGYVSCGDFTGEDKSCSAFRGVLEQIIELPFYAPDAEFGSFVNRMRGFLSGNGDSEWSDYLLLPQQHAMKLEPYVEACKQSLVAELNTDDHFEAMEKEDAVSGLDPIEAKWGEGKGWRLYCVHELLRAIAQSKLTGTDIVISFD